MAALGWVARGTRPCYMAKIRVFKAGAAPATVRTGCLAALQSTRTAGKGRSRPRSGAKRLVADRLVFTWALLGTPPGLLTRRPELARVTSSDTAAPHNFSRETTLRPDILRATSATFSPRACTLEGVPVGTPMDGLWQAFNHKAVKRGLRSVRAAARHSKAPARQGREGLGLVAERNDSSRTDSFSPGPCWGHLLGC